MSYSVIITGVTEQPVYWTAQILAHIAVDRGYQVQLSGSPEARAGKAVMAFVRWGKGILSPVVPKGDCQLVIGLEPLEAVRTCLDHYTLGMKVVSASLPLRPTSVTHGKWIYPPIHQMFERLERNGITHQLIKNEGIEDKLIAIKLISTVINEGQPLVEFGEIYNVLIKMGELDLAKHTQELGETG